MPRRFSLKPRVLTIASRLVLTYGHIEALYVLYVVVDIHPKFLQDLPDVQELIAEVNAEKYSLQAAAILGESTFVSWLPLYLPATCFYCKRSLTVFVPCSAWLCVQS